MGDRPTFLMCAPEHYGVHYVINPWMEAGRRRESFPLASQQWASLHGILSKLPGVCVRRIPAQPGLPDMVFTANAGLVVDRVFVPSRFLYAERAGEEKWFTSWANDDGFEIRTLPESVYFEGAGDALFDRRRPLLWMGHGFRTSVEAASPLSDIVRPAGFDIIPLRLVDPRYYHLDTCFCPLLGGYTMYVPDAFDAESLKVLEAVIPPEERIVVDAEDAGKFACNAVNVGNTVVLNAAGPGLRRQLEDRGFSVVETALADFMLAGGAAKCLTLRLDEPVRNGLEQS